MPEEGSSPPRETPGAPRAHSKAPARCATTLTPPAVKASPEPKAGNPLTKTPPPNKPLTTIFLSRETKSRCQRVWVGITGSRCAPTCHIKAERNPFAWQTAHGMSQTRERLFLCTPGRLTIAVRGACCTPAQTPLHWYMQYPRPPGSKSRYAVAGSPRASHEKTRHPTRPVWGVPVPLCSLLVNKSSGHANTVPGSDSRAGHPLTL